MANEVIVFDAEDVNKNKGTGILIAIFFFLFFLPLVAEDMKNSAYLKHIANSALLLTIGYVAGTVITSIIQPLGGLVNLAIFVYHVMLIINAVQANGKSLPLLDKFQLIK